MTTEEPKIIGPQPGPQTLALSSPADVLIYGGAAGGGKLLCVDTLIPTPNGFVRLADIHRGDFVIGRNGAPIQVLAESETVVASAWRLTFDDGSQLIAHDDHLWLTFDSKELSQLLRCNPMWRAKRRERRASRSAVGSRNKTNHTAEHRAFLSTTITARNKSRQCAVSEPPQGTVRTTSEIVQTIKTLRGRTNHAIPVAAAIALDDQSLPLDPYALGVWLGDGTTCNGEVTSADEFIFDELSRLGFSIARRTEKKSNAASSCRLHGLREALHSIGVIGDKHVPHKYLWASREQRLALLQGLLDTDGEVSATSGHVTFTNTRRCLTEAVAFLARSLGHKATVRESVAKLDGRAIGPCWKVKFAAKMQVCRLPRKAERIKLATRQTTRFRYIIDAECVESATMKCLRVDADDGLFLAGESFIPTHNSYGLLLEAARYIRLAGFGATIFRREYPQFFEQGGLWPVSEEIYPHLGGVPKKSKLRWEFPSGASIRFSHFDPNHLTRRQGAQIAMIGIDEITEFSEKEFWFLLSRNRTMCGIKPYFRATCNPDSEHWLASFLSWWIDPQSGYPIPERAGRLRWMVRDEDEKLNWANKRETLLSRFAGSLPISVAFVPASLDDNKILDAADPTYRGRLMSMNRVERERFLGGNWLIRPAAGLVFPADRWKYIKRDVFAAMAQKMRFVRGWDKAGTDRGHGPRSAGVLVAGPKNVHSGPFYIVDAHAGRWDDDRREAEILATARRDNIEWGSVHTELEKEGGSGGGHSARMTLRNLAGLSVGASAPQGEKAARWRPLSAQQQAGNVYLVEGEWIPDFIRELDALSGDKKMDGPRLKDLADAASLGFNKLTSMFGAGVIDGELLTNMDDTDYDRWSKEEKDAMPAFLKDLCESTGSYDDDD